MHVAVRGGRFSGAYFPDNLSVGFSVQEEHHAEVAGNGFVRGWLIIVYTGAIIEYLVVEEDSLSVFWLRGDY